MIIAAFVILLIICALLAGLVTGGAVIAGILLLVGLIVIIAKSVSGNDKDTVNVTVTNPESEKRMFPEISSSGEALIADVDKEVNNNKTIIVKYDPAPDREVPEELKIPLERAYIALNGAQYDEASIHFGRILDQDPHFAPAYIGKLLCELKIRDEKNLAKVGVNFTKCPYWDSACRFATEDELNRYLGYLQACKTNIAGLIGSELENIQEYRKKHSHREILENYDWWISIGDDFVDDENILKLRDALAKSKEKYEYKRSITILALILIVVIGACAAFVLTRSR